MKNTKEKGILHVRIFKWNGRYIGICKETGFIEEADDFSIVKKMLSNGIIALLGALHKSKQNLELSINTRPAFRYAVYFHLAPILILIEFCRDSMGEYDFSAQSIRHLQTL